MKIIWKDEITICVDSWKYYATSHMPLQIKISFQFLRAKKIYYIDNLDFQKLVD